jgi:hypothetical protein
MAKRDLVKYLLILNKKPPQFGEVFFILRKNILKNLTLNAFVIFINNKKPYIAVRFFNNSWYFL